VSRQFLSWVIALGDGAKIVSPESVVERMKQEAVRLMEQYGDNYEWRKISYVSAN